MAGWGKAGVRLTPADRAARAAQRARARRAREASDARARAAWQAGLLQPHTITTVLDAADLFGPEVDRSLGVVDPTVDEWEAGTRYPSWEQVLALAVLAGVTPEWLVKPRPRPPVTVLCSVDDGGLPSSCEVTDPARDELVLAFTPAALAATLGALTVVPLRRP